jgi:peptidoglycan biosynthesis protein MviN/MurJ (putative lipid II flippase)
MLRVALAAVLGAALMMQFDRLEITHAGISLRGSLPAFTPLPLSGRATDQAVALRLGAVGLALAAGMSSWLEFALLRRHLARRRGLRARVGGGALARTALSGVLAGVVGVAVRFVVASQPLLWQLMTISAAIVAVYLAGAHLLGLTEMAELRRLVARRRR